MKAILLSLGSLKIQKRKIHFVDTLLLAHYKNYPLHWCPFITSINQLQKGYGASMSEKGN
jgi:hypothetical protein